MNTEDYVSYEQAVKLKEKGYNEPCYNYWSLEPDGKPCVMTSTLCNVRNSDLKGRDATAPCLWEAQKWLREEHKIQVNAWFSLSHDKWTFTFTKIFGGYIWAKTRLYDSYEEALSAGITKALELI